MKDKTWEFPKQLAAYLVICLAAIGLTLILMPASKAYFQLYFGSLHPLFAVTLVSIVGGFALALLLYRAIR